MKNLCLHFFVYNSFYLFLIGFPTCFYMKMHDVLISLFDFLLFSQAALPAARLLKDQDRFVRARACATLGRCVVTPEVVELLCLGQSVAMALGLNRWKLRMGML